MVQEKLRAVFYARVSTAEEEQLKALPKQVEECKDVIASKGWKLVDGYVDEGKSGTKTDGRKAYKKLLEDMQQDKFEIVVVKSQDRLQRNTFDWYRFTDLLNKNGKQLFLYIDNKFYEPSEDALITGIKAILAEEYSRDLSKKLNNANKRRIEKAKAGGAVSAMGNSQMYGYRIIDGKWVIEPDEAKVVKKMYQLSVSNDNKSIEEEILKLENKKGKLIDLYTDELITKEEFMVKSNELETNLEKKKALLVPVEHNPDIEAIEDTIKNIDAEIESLFDDEAMVMEKKIQFITEHIKKVVVFGNRDVFIVLDSMAGAFLFLDKEDARIEIVPMEEYNASELSEVGITEKDFVPFDRESMPQHHGSIHRTTFSNPIWHGI